MPVLKKISPRYICTLILVYGAFFFSAQISPTREYQVKAVFLFNFSQFVEWPAHCFPSAQSPAVIGILGKDPFGKYLEETISGETINKHPLVLKRFDNVEDIANCHILFINITDKDKLEQIIQKLKGKNILTVSDTNDFSKLGGMVRLYTKNDKINIQVNLDETKSENLTVSSKLLKLAEIVKTDKK